MKPLLITLAAVFTMVGQADAELISTGTAIIQAQKALEETKHTKTGLDMLSMTPRMALDFWNVDEGVLIISYSTTTGLISSLSFVLMDERSKSTRKEFHFAAVSFDTMAGTLVLSTKKPE